MTLKPSARHPKIRQSNQIGILGPKCMGKFRVNTLHILANGSVLVVRAVVQQFEAAIVEVDESTGAIQDHDLVDVGALVGVGAPVDDLLSLDPTPGAGEGHPNPAGGSNHQLAAQSQGRHRSRI